MPRTRIIDSIEDLQLEWATKYPNQSLREFLKETKGYTDRQYRYIVDRSPAVEWKARRTEIQNQVTVTKVERFANEAAEFMAMQMQASRLTAAKAMKALTNPDLTTSELVQLATALEKAQRICLNLIGPPSPDAANYLSHMLERKEAKSHSASPAKAEKQNEYSYEDVIEIIELRREIKKMKQAGTA